MGLLTDAETDPSTPSGGTCSVRKVRYFFRSYPVETETFERWLTQLDLGGEYERSAAWIARKINERVGMHLLGVEAVKRHRRGDCKCTR